MADPTSKESLKRENYFTFKRDEIMAMDEYLLSPISEIDLRKMNEGGIASIENMTGPIGMAAGGPIPPEEPKKEIKGGFESLSPIGLLDDAADLRILSMKLVLKEAANTLLEMDEIDNMTPIEIESMYNSLIGKKGA